MTYTVRLEIEAVLQLGHIERYIAERATPSIAQGFVDAVIDHCRGLDQFPNRGAMRDDIRPGLRTISYKKRVTIAFVVDETARLVSVIGVFYGGQDFESALAEG